MTARRATGYDILVDYMTTGYWQDQRLPAFVLDPGPDKTITVNTSGLTAAGRFLAQNAMEAWETVADITFVENAASTAQIRFDDNQPAANTRFNYDSNRDASFAQINISTDWLAQNGTVTGAYSFQTYMHEIGHALGLGHPGEYNGGNVVWDSSHSRADSYQLSLMSYFGQDENPYTVASRAAAVTPMLADILAIQRVYGAASGGATAGTTVYGVGATLGTYLGDYQRDGYVTGIPLPYAATFTIFDEGGIDTIDLSHHGKPQIIKLAPGGISDVIGQVGNMIIMPGTVIENYIAGFGADNIAGNRAGNLIDGGRGDDVIRGAAGADTLRGGDHDDRLIGGAGGDLLTGGRGNDVMRGGRGVDVFVFGQGEDVIVDFNPHDSLRFEDTLWNGRRDVSIAEIMDQAQVTADGVVFDFGRLGSLTLAGWTRLPDLADHTGLA